MTVRKCNECGDSADIRFTNGNLVFYYCWKCLSEELNDMFQRNEEMIIKKEGHQITIL